MHLRNTVYTTTAVLAAASLSVLGAWWSAVAVENRSAEAVRTHLMVAGVKWASVTPNGLQIHLAGTAPNEAERFRAVNLVGSVVQSSRIRDSLEVAALRAIEAPRFSVEMLRNDDGISLIGLIPGREREAKLAASVATLARGMEVADMLETADYPAPAGWDEALKFGLFALKLLPRSKISVGTELVAITAISGSSDEKRRLESELARALPKGLKARIEISAPRPVLTPFTLRFVKDEDGARFDACSADTTKARERILSAGSRAGVAAKTACTVGLGVPTPRWTEAAELAIAAVDDLGFATVTFSDADVSLVAASTTVQAVFDRVIGDLQTQLPPVFSLKAVLTPKPSAAPQGPAEFTAVLGEDGQAQLRGRLSDELSRDAVDSFAKAQFGTDQVYTGTRLDGDLPDGWPVRVLAGLEAMAQLHHGNLKVQPDLVEISGITGRPDGSARISQILSDKLGQGKTFRIDVTYDEKYDPMAAVPAPQDCVAQMNQIISLQKISFAPGSAEIEGDTQTTIDALAEVVKGCPPLVLEISGHTDSQGSEGGNLALSQARADAVLTALQGRRLKVEGFFAKGYGEADPIADNGSEVGREANRRIEFKLLSEPEEVMAPSPIDLVRAAQNGLTALDSPDAAPDAASDDAALTSDEMPAEEMPADDTAGDDFGSGDDYGSGDGAEPDDSGSGDDGSGDAGPDADSGNSETGGEDLLADEAPPAAGTDAVATAEQATAPEEIVVAGADLLPDLGPARSVEIPDSPALLFQPTDEKWPRPRKRP